MNNRFKSLITSVIVSFAIIIGAFIFAPVQSHAASSDNTKSTAVQLTLNQVSAGALSNKDAKNWYKFTITEHGYFRIRLSATDNTDEEKIGYAWDMKLYRSGDTTPFETFTGVNCGYDTIVYPFPTGDYYVCLSTHNSYAAPVDAEYGIKVEFTADDMWEKEENDKSSTANVIDINKTYFGNLHYSREIDYYKFTTTEAGVFDIKFSLDPDTTDVDKIGYGWSMTILDQDLKEIETYSAIENNLKSEKYPFEAGTFYIKIENHNSYASPIGVIYGVTAEFTPEKGWESEYNNTSAVSDTISVNKVVNGSLYTRDDVDWYKVTVPKAGYSSVTFGPDADVNMDNVGYGWDVVVYDKDLKEIIAYKEQYNKFTTQLFGFEKGTYYVKVVAHNTYATPKNCIYNLTYNFKENSLWESEWNDTKAKADKLTLNKTFTGVLTHANDVDYYKVTAAAKGTIKIDFTKDSSVGAEETRYGWDVYVYNSNNKELVCKKEIKGKDSATIDVSKGSFYIKVCAHNSYYAPTQCLYKISAKYAQAPKATTIKKATPERKKVTLTWNKVSDATGYYVYRSTSKNGEYKKIATIKKNTTLKYVDKKGLGSKKTYYYKIVSYKTANGVTATTDSKVKSAKTK